MENKEGKEIILVTGFGPFSNHMINASWEAVKLLPDEFEDFRLLKVEIPVCYSDIEDTIPNLWLSYKPRLVIHVGVSSEAKQITIERTANRIGYRRKDCYGLEHPTGNACTADLGPDCLETGIDVIQICNSLNEKCDVLKYGTSNNAGRYLCEFIYYTSLRVDKNRCIFIHVPPLNSPYSAQELSSGILSIIAYALNQSKLS